MQNSKPNKDANEKKSIKSLFNSLLNKIKKRKSTRLISLILICIILALPAFLIAITGIFRSVDYLIEDTLYQHENDSPSNIVIITITTKDVEEYGFSTNPEQCFYNLIAKLYDNEKTYPMIVGIDYPLRTITNETSANNLAEICKYKNIVVSNTFTLKSTVVVGDYGLTGKEDEIEVQYDGLPYEQLTQNVIVGYSNLFYDTDGLLRHYAWTIDELENKSFAYQVYEAYSTVGLENLEPVRTSSSEVCYISFYGTHNKFKTYSYSDFIKGNYNKEEFTNKIVLVGAYDELLTQGYITAIDRKEMMYNVEIQANVIANIIDGKQIVEVPTILQLIILWIFQAFVIYLFFTHKSLQDFIIFISGLALVCVLSNLLWKFGHPFHVFYFAVCLIITYSINIGFDLKKEKLSKLFIQEKMDKLVDPNISQTILTEAEEKKDPEPISKNICVLFADIRSFTIVSSSLESKQIVAMLNKYFTVACKCIKDNEGTIDKFIGDAIMAYWGAPNDVEDGIFKACKAALELQQAIEKLNQEIYSEFDRCLSFGIGINYGEATVGYVRSEEHYEYTAIGDIVNMASRIESLAPRGCVYISEIVKEKLGNRARVSGFAHPYSIKGKDKPMNLYLLEALDERPGYYEVQVINEVKES